MKIEQKIIARFAKVVTDGTVGLMAKDNVGRPQEYLPLPMVTGWRIKATALLSNVMTEDSIYYREFMSLVMGDGQAPDETFNKNIVFAQAVEIVKAAWEDYQGGYFVSVQTRIAADLFDDFLDRADYLLSDGDYQAAAVIAGIVLENTLRKICDREGIVFPPKSKPTISVYNQELAKKAIYGKPMLHQVNKLGALRNHAAHGEWTEFTEEDVVKMIVDVREFMAKYFA